MSGDKCGLNKIRTGNNQAMKDNTSSFVRLLHGPFVVALLLTMRGSVSAQTLPIAQQAYLKASNTGPGDGFGSRVAISGDTVLVSAPKEDSNARGVNGIQSDNSASWAGANYVFVRNGTTWSQQAYLKASNTQTDDLFGAGLAISGDTAVVGAYYESSNATGVNGDQNSNSASRSGAAYVFVRSGTSWTQQAYLKASNTGAIDWFGWWVAVSGDTVVVGAEQEDSNATGVNGSQSNNSASNSGAAYVFVRNGTTWSQQAYLKASNTGADDRFGTSVAISDDTIIVGAPWEDSDAAGVNGNQNDNSALYAGAAYVFVRSGTIWSRRAYLKASNPGASDGFGAPLAISNDTLIVGANKEKSNATGVNGNQSDNSVIDSGAAYVFTGLGPPTPALAINSSPGGVRLSWPRTGAAWVLEHSDGLDIPAGWSPLPPPYESDGSDYFFTMPEPVDRQFFRLRKP